MNEFHMCPKCGGLRFAVTAHVCQDWEVDEAGAFVSVINDCSEVDHEPDDNDLWECRGCGYQSAGSEFLCKEEAMTDLQKAQRSAAEAMRRLIETHGKGITVNIRAYVEDDETVAFECEGSHIEDAPTFDTAEEAEEYLSDYLSCDWN